MSSLWKRITKTHLKGPICLTEDIYNNLGDFNATSEEFTELSARIYIISRRFYELLNEYGIKGLRGEVIIIK